MIAWAVLAAVVVAHAPASEPDPYAALKSMDGHWRVTTGSGRTENIDNACSRAGLFFVCEQRVGGKPAALVVFLPKGRDEGRDAWRVQTLTAAGDRPGPWKDLAVDGTTWTISDAAHAAGRRMRTVITHSGPDFMHVEVQAQEKGETWTPISSESFVRR